MPTAVFNGVKLYYEETGSGQPLVMVHGSWMDHHTWDQVAPSLAESFRVLTYDRRGHSQSERPATQGSIQEDVADLAALIEGRGLSPAHIIGSSFGGSIVLRMATERPGLFRSLSVHEPPLVGVLAGGPTTSTAGDKARSRIVEIVGMISTGKVEEGARLFWDGIVGLGGWDERLSLETKQAYLNNAPTFLDEVREPGAFTLDLGALGSFSRPSMLSAGAASFPAAQAIVTRIAEAITGARKHTFEGAGHIPHQTHPDQFVDAVTSFVQTVV